MKIKGKVSIHRSSNDRVYISLKDEASGIEFAEASLSLEAFGAAVTGLSLQPAEIELGGLDKLGMTREHKAEIVTFNRFPGGYEGRDEQEKLAREALKPFEVDGWIGRSGDLLNHHNRTKDGAGYRVVFERWVPTEKEEQA